MVKVDSVDYSAYLKNGYSQTDNFQIYSRFIANRLSRTNTFNKNEKSNVDGTHKNKKVIELIIPLTANHYTNVQNMHVCSPINIKSARDDNNDIAAGIITVNNFFAHWIKEIGTKSYGDDIPILPLTNTFEKTLYSKEKVIL